jgi:hypothetical protein
LSNWVTTFQSPVIFAPPRMSMGSPVSLKPIRRE